MEEKIHMSETDDLSQIPQNEASTVVEEPKPKKRRGRPPKSKKRSGDDLAPNFEEYHGSTSRWLRFWVGLLPHCPQHVIRVAGITFKHRGGSWKEDRFDPSGERFETWDGTLVVMNKEKFEIFKERVPRTVVRITEKKMITNVAGDEIVPPPRVEIITIPTDEQIKAREEAGFPITPYDWDPDKDHAFCDLAYCIHFEEGDPDRALPGSMRDTGLKWPEE